MGLCESCFEKPNDNYGSDGPHDTDPLLNPSARPAAPQSFGETHIKTLISQQKGDEQSSISRIINITESNVIDVTQVGGKGIEQHEYHDKARQYSNRISAVLSGSYKTKMFKPFLPIGVSAPQPILASQPILFADVELITNATAEAAKAMREVRVDHREDLIAHFTVQ